MAEQATALAALVDAVASAFFIIVGLIACASVGVSISRAITYLKG